MINKPKIVFMGTPDFAVPSMTAIYEKFGLCAVVTNPDKPKGRGLKLSESAVKIAAKEFNAPILQPSSLKDADFFEQMKALSPDIIVVVAFKILPPAIYNLATIGTFNIHGSLLPRYRGAAPINWAIINGDKKTGLTTFLLNETVDTGKLILQSETEIADTETLGDIWDKLKAMTPEIAINTIDALLSPNPQLVAQDESLASKAPKIFPDDCKIDWSKNSAEINNLIRGVSPRPGAWTIFEDKRFKIAKAEILDVIGETGTYQISADKFIVYSSDTALSLIEIQPEGKPIMPVKNFLNGHRGLKEGKI